MVTRLGNVAESVEDQTSHCLVRALRKFDAQSWQVVDREAAGKHDTAIVLAHGGRHLAVGFVVDLADELLDQVLHRDDARRAAVLVDDQRHLGSVRAHLTEGSKDAG